MKREPKRHMKVTIWRVDDAQLPWVVKTTDMQGRKIVCEHVVAKFRDQVFAWSFSRQLMNILNDGRVIQETMADTSRKMRSEKS